MRRVCAVPRAVSVRVPVRALSLSAPASDVARLPRHLPKRLRPATNRERWLSTLRRLGADTQRLSLAGGLVHQRLYEIMIRDAKALHVPHPPLNIYAMERQILVPALQRQLRRLNLDTTGDYPTLRNRLQQNSNVFSNISGLAPTRRRPAVPAAPADGAAPTEHLTLVSRLLEEKQRADEPFDGLLKDFREQQEQVARSTTST